MCFRPCLGLEMNRIAHGSYCQNPQTLMREKEIKIESNNNNNTMHVGENHLRD